MEGHPNYATHQHHQFEGQPANQGVKNLDLIALLSAVFNLLDK